MDFLQKLFKIRTKDPLRLMILGRRDLDAAQLAQYRTRIQKREKELAEVSDGRELYHRFLSETSLSRALVIGITPDAPGISRPKPAKLSEEDFLKALNTLPAGVLIRSWLDEDLARLEIRDGSVCVVVPDIVLAGITESERKRLALGTEARIILRLERTGVVNKSGFDIREQWIRNGRTIFAPDVDGVMLSAGNGTHLLPSVFVITHDAILRFRQEFPAAPEYAWAKLSDTLKTTRLDPITQTAGGLRLICASEFSLRVEKSGRIRPYFLRPNPLPAEDRKTFTSLLSERQLRSALNQMEPGKEIPDHLVLDGSTFVFLPKELRRVLRVVNDLTAEGGEAANRLMFDPVLAVRKALLKGRDETEALADPEVSAALDAAESLFVETPEFLSARVEGFGPWSPKHLGFVDTFKAPWFPDGEGRMTILVGGEAVSFTPEELKAFGERLEKAVADGDSTIPVNGTDIDVSQIDVEKIRALLKEKEEPQKRRDDAGKPEDEKAKSVKYGPILKDNLEVLSYLASRPKQDPFTHPTPGLGGDFTLLEHQKEALEWLKGLWNHDVPGALLADDMGLGKTLQCLTFLEWLRRGFSKQDQQHPALVVAPVGLLYNWQAEGRKYFPDTLGEPMLLTSEALREGVRLGGLDFLREVDDAAWVLTSYETLRNKNEFFRRVDWGLVVFDEVQKIKNPTSLVTEMAKTLQSRFALALTGTPVENGFQDLWSIMDTVVPGFMGSLRDFNETYGRNDDIEESGRELHRIHTGQATAPGLEAEEADRTKVRPIALMLRRLKTDRLKALPQKTLVTHRMVMPPRQRDAYERILEARRFAPMRPENSPLAVLQRLNRCSFSPDGGDLSEASIEHSARLKQLFEILDGIAAKREKVVIFVQYRYVQQGLAELIRDRMKMRRLPGIINGGMDASRRQRVVNDFQEGPDGFDAVIHTGRAAGTGLTLTAANHVVHLERWWNPAVEDQCSDRVYRIGQTKDVVIHIPMAVMPDGEPPSFDDTLETFLARKRIRSQSVLAPVDADPTHGDLIRTFFGATDDELEDAPQEEAGGD